MTSAANLAPVIKQQFFDANGNPLAGGKLYSYVAGSAGAIQLPTYKSNFVDPTNRNTNPVILDSAGRADVWLDSYSYLFKLYDANDVLIWTVDQVAVASANTALFGTKTDAQNATIAAGVTFIATTGYSTPGDGGNAGYVKVGGNPNVGAGGFQSVDGAWWQYALQGPMRIEQFGGKADLVIGGLYGGIVGVPTDNIQPFNDMCLQRPYSVNANYSQVQICEFKAGGYYFSQQLEPRVVVHLKGQGGGSDNLIGTIFRFPANCSGFVCNNRATGNGGVITPGTLGTAEGSILEDIYLLGGGWTGTDNTKHGVWERATLRLIRVTSDNFPGHAFATIANNASSDPTKVGNANGWYKQRCIARNAGYHGFYVEGVDTNAGKAEACQVKNAMRGGFIDRSGLGNTYVGCECDSTNNAIANVGNGSHAWFAGVGYEMVTSDSTVAAATQPGTDETIWYPFLTEPAPSAGVPAWSNTATYIMGLSYFAEGESNRSVFIGCYSESILADISNSVSIAIGGQVTFTHTSRAMGAVTSAAQALYINAGIGGYRDLSISALRVHFGGNQEAAVGTTIGRGQANDYAYLLYGCDADSGLYQLQQSYNADFALQRGGLSGGNKPLYKHTGSRTSRTLGRPLPVKDMFCLPAFVLEHESDSTQFVTMRAANTKPVLGIFGRSDIVWNGQQAVGQPIFWVCTTAGAVSATARINNTSYGIGDTVLVGGNTYIADLAAPWAPMTAYTVGNIRSNNGANYQCTTPGTSGASGPNGQDMLQDGTVVWVQLSGSLQVSGTTPPAGTGAKQQDGTIFWTYVTPFVLSNGPVL